MSIPQPSPTVTPRTNDGHDSLVALIRVLYGLAIVSGFKTAVDWYASAPVVATWFYFIAISALAVGVSDWLMYHFIVLKHPYDSILPLVADILFPIGIFLLFWGTRDLSIFLLYLAVYFVCCEIYILFLRKRLNPAERRQLGYPPLLAASIVVAAFLVFYATKGDHQVLCTVLSVVGSAIWVIINMRFVKKRFDW